MGCQNSMDSSRRRPKIPKMTDGNRGGFFVVEFQKKLGLDELVLF